MVNLLNMKSWNATNINLPQSLQRHRCLQGRIRVSRMSLMQMTHSKPVSSNSLSSSCQKCLNIKNKKHQEGRGDFNLFTPVILLVKFSPCCLPYNSDWALCTIFLKVAFWQPSIVRQSPQKYFVKKQIMVISKCSMNEKVTQKSQDQG